MTEVMFGAIAATCFIAGLIFWRYWRATGDRFFILFALSFWVEALNRAQMAISDTWREDDVVSYTVRLIAYGLILLAILDKNRPRSK